MSDSFKAIKDIVQESSRPIRVLLVDDSEEDFIVTRQTLLNAGPDEYILDWEDGYENGKSAVLKQEHDVYIFDYRLGARNGLDLFLKLRELGCEPPVIMLTSEDGLGLATEAIRMGASDFLVKGQIDTQLLVRSIRYAIERNRFRKQEVASQDLLKEHNRRLSELYATAHQFVDNVSHEFRTPLTVIKEFTSILADGLAGEMNAEQKEFTDIILARVDDLSHMVNDMLDISRLEAGLLGVQRREYEVSEVIERVRSTIERRAAMSGIGFTIEIAEELLTIYCDAENIGRVIINLVTNACKFCGDDGEVALWARHAEQQGHIAIGVTDNGQGISPGHKQTIFERFRQVGGDIRASSKGFGLGLNIAKELVHINFGEIDVQSEDGCGSTFSFTVPTFRPVDILHLFSMNYEHLRSGTSYVSLISVCALGNPDEESCQDFEQLLERQLRRCDLTFRAHSGEWLVCAGSNRPQLGEMLERIEKAREERNKVTPDIRLPEIEFCIHGSWNMEDDLEGLVQAFKAEWSAAEAKRAAALLNPAAGCSPPCAAETQRV